MKNWLRNNALSVVFLLLFLFALVGQIFTGFKENNQELNMDGHPSLTLSEYLSSGHFVQATFENWESEFLQMALFVILTVSLRQKGSSESKKFEPDKVDREPDPKRTDAPWPVRKGGWILKVYENSLSLMLTLLFIVSFYFHLWGSLRDENDKLVYRNLPVKTMGEYLGEPRFWFESFQNWQSEFLSVFAVVVLSIFLRQKSSSQSKPVDAPDSETGE